MFFSSYAYEEGVELEVNAGFGPRFLRSNAGHVVSVEDNGGDEISALAGVNLGQVYARTVPENISFSLKRQ